MGLAVLVDQESCIAFQGLRCEVCYQVCPIKDKAITLEIQHNPRSGKHALFIPVVHSDHCTGCGKCEEACILEEAAIKVLPKHLAKGKLGSTTGSAGSRRPGRRALVTPDAGAPLQPARGHALRARRPRLIQEGPLPGQPAGYAQSPARCEEFWPQMNARWEPRARVVLRGDHNSALRTADPTRDRGP
jgi:ferredoxin-type protein NapG